MDEGVEVCVVVVISDGQYGVSRGDGEKTTIVRGLLRGNRGLFTQRSRWSIEYNTSQVRFSAFTGVSIHHTSTPSARTSWIKDIKAVSSPRSDTMTG